MAVLDDVLRADESGAKAVRDDGSCEVTYMCNMFDGLHLHVAVADGFSRPGGVKVVLPFGPDKFDPLTGSHYGA